MNGVEETHSPTRASHPAPGKRLALPVTPSQ